MRLATAVYLIVAVINLYAQFVGDQNLNQFTKPVLMPALIYLVFLRSKGFINLPRLLLALALIFAWIGDLLLLNQNDEMFFLGGLGSFLVMQILYCIIFFKSMHEPQLPKRSYTGSSIIAFAVITYFIYQYAGDMWLAVAIYALTILAMLLFAFNRNELTSLKSFRYVLAGALLFVISDSLIGINKFIFEIPKASFLIMLTYIPAQYLITSGILEDKES